MKTVPSGTGDDSDHIVVAAVEGGGTTFVVAVADLSAGNVLITHRLEVDSSNGDPQRTLAECASFLEQHKPPGGYHALGIASFGPVGVNDMNLSTYGTILASTPKATWRNVNLLEPLRMACQGSKRTLKIKIDTDVNAPALAEFFVTQKNINNNNITSLAYITCGTGVGVGLVIHGQCVHGRMHPEAGHVPVQPLPGDNFQGYSWGSSKSPFFGVHTVEGIASSVALTERLQQIQGNGGYGGNSSSSSSDAVPLNRSVLGDLPDDHELWDHAANALANLCVTLLLTVSIEKIVLGGGVLKRRGLMEKIRERTVVLLNGYLELPSEMSTLICSPYYGETVGLIGAIMLAKQSLALDNTQKDLSTKTKKFVTFENFYGAIVGATATIAIIAFTTRFKK